MNISLFGYILLALVAVLAAYLASVSRVELPLERDEQSTVAERESHPAELSARREGSGPDATDRT